MSRTFERVFEEYGNAVRRETAKKFNAALSEKDKEIAFLKAELERRIREELSHKN